MRSYGMLLLGLSMTLAFSVPRTTQAADDGARVFSESCTPCHTQKVRPLDKMHLTRDQWKAEVDRMIDQGAEVPKKKMSDLLDYLVNTFGPAGESKN
jgi:cytochrome c5